jgi:LacI family transcriptional regulator
MALCLQGIADYAQQHGGWTLLTSPPTLGGAEEQALTMRALNDWPGQGAIAAVGTAAEVRAARRLPFPVVNLAGSLRHCGLPRVMVDQRAAGRLAAEHLLSRGLRRLAGYGLAGLWYAQQRLEGFAERARQSGVACDLLQTPVPVNAATSWRRRTTPLVEWLKTLRPPVGIFAVHDYRARVLVDACQLLGLRVPHDVAVLGMDNDTTVCEFCQPPLSSVSRSARQVGFQAAALLDRLMAGKPAEREILVPPDGVVLRRSTDTVVSDNPHVCEAIQLMHDHLGEAITVEHIVAHAAISRRLLEKLFRQHLGCTPREYLCRMRVERAKQLLAAPQRPKMRDVIAACGLGDARRFRRLFVGLEGQTPAQYRRSTGAAGSRRAIPERLARAQVPGAAGHKCPG